jgi:hypothetical protein
VGFLTIFFDRMQVYLFVVKLRVYRLSRPRFLVRLSKLCRKPVRPYLFHGQTSVHSVLLLAIRVACPTGEQRTIHMIRQATLYDPDELRTSSHDYTTLLTDHHF